MLKILQSSAFAAIVGLVLYVGVTAALWPSFKLASATPSAPNLPRMARTRGPSWEFQNPDLEALLQEVKQEKAALAERRKQLDELAARLQAEQLEMNAVTQAVADLQRQIDELLVRVTEEETANLKKLAKTYAAMSPDGATAILRQLDEATIVKILLFMKESETAPILETLAMLGEGESQLAATISERLRLAVFRPPATKTRL
jgi:flagellar motility protein MotE (MotC chaperone)